MTEEGGLEQTGFTGSQLLRFLGLLNLVTHSIEGTKPEVSIYRREA